jgi:hypothetical protein
VQHFAARRPASCSACSSVSASRCGRGRSGCGRSSAPCAN